MRTPYQTASGRLVARIHKTVGRCRIDALAVKPIDTARKPPAVDRIVLASEALGNLLLPDQGRTWKVGPSGLTGLCPAIAYSPNTPGGTLVAGPRDGRGYRVCATWPRSR